MGSSIEGFTYSLEEWEEALEAAEFRGWCPIDSREKESLLAEWICVEVIDPENVGRDLDIVDAAFAIFKAGHAEEFTPRQLAAVLDTYSGDGVRHRFDLA